MVENLSIYRLSFYRQETPARLNSSEFLEQVHEGWSVWCFALNLEARMSGLFVASLSYDFNSLIKFSKALLLYCAKSR